MSSDDPSATAPDTANPRATAGYALVLLAGAVVLFPALGVPGLWDPWEATYAEAAREMRERGSLFVPYFAGEVRLVEPPLVYWGVLLGSAALGATELGARVGGACLALAAMLCVCYVVSRLRGTRAGVLSALVLGSCPLFYMLARQATPDIYLACTAGSSLLFFCLAISRDDGRRRLHCVAGGIGLALALLARGPLLAVASVIVPLALFALTRSGIGVEHPGSAAGDGTRFPMRRPWRGVVLVALLVAALAGPWYAGAMALHGSPGDLLLAFQPAPEAPSQGDVFGYYLRGWIFGFFPWSCFLPLVPAILAAASTRRAAGFEGCLLASAVASFLLVNSSEARFPQSLAVVGVPAAVLLGLTIDRIAGLARGGGARLAWAAAALLYLPPMTDLLRARGLKYLFNSFTFERDLPPDFVPGNAFALLLLSGLALLLLSVLLHSRLLVGAFVALAVVLATFNGARVGPAVGAEKTMREMCRAWSREPGAGPLGVYGELSPSLRYYSAGRAVLLASPKDFMEHMAPGSTAFAIVTKEQLVPVDTAYRRQYAGHRLHVIDRSRRDFILLGNHPPGAP